MTQMPPSQPPAPLDDLTAAYAPKGEKRKQRHLQRRNEMLDTAMALVLEEGIDGLTVAKLAKRLGAAVGALYRYFPSKSDLVVALQSRSINSYGTALQSHLEAFDGKVGATLPKAEFLLARSMVALSMYSIHAVQSPEHHHLIDSLLSEHRIMHSDAQLQDINRTLAPILDMFAETLAEAAAADVLQDGDHLQRVYLVWGAVHGIEHFRKGDRVEKPAPLQTPALLKALFSTFYTAWGVESELFDRAYAVAQQVEGHLS